MMVTHPPLRLTTAEGGGDSLQGLLNVTMSTFPFEPAAGYVQEHLAQLLGFVVKTDLKPSKKIPLK